MDVSLDARIAKGAGENCVEVTAKHGKAVGWDGYSISKVAVGAPVELAELDFSSRGPDRLESLRDYLLTNPVSGNDGDAFLGRLVRVHGRKANTSRAE